MPTSEEIAAKNGLIHLPSSEDYIGYFEGRNLHWGEPTTIHAIGEVAAEMRKRYPDYKLEIGNITGPDRVNGYSKTHQGRNFDMAYPYANGESGIVEPEGKTTSPYRKAPEHVDCEKLHALLSILCAHPKNQQVLIGQTVHPKLQQHIKANQLDALPKVHPYPGHDDHIHVAMNGA